MDQRARAQSNGTYSPIDVDAEMAAIGERSS